MENFVCRICGGEYHDFKHDSNIFHCCDCGVTFIDPEKFSLPKIKFTKLSDKAIIPIKAHCDDSGFDLFAAHDEILYPSEVKLIKTNIAIELPKNHEAQIRCRSSLGKKGITLPNGVGTIDQPYRGDLGVLLLNTTSDEFKIEYGNRIAQLIICKSMPFILEEVEELSETERGDGGFGSTGV